METQEIENKVANSSIVSIDLENYYLEGERVLFDIKYQLYEGIILKEKDFRLFLKEHNWHQYQDKLVAIFCTEDAIIPTWAFMLLNVYLKPVAKKVVYGNIEQLEQEIWQDIISKIDFSIFEGQKVVIKGCGKKYIPNYAYSSFTLRLLDFAKSIMYGEPCSTVPIYKKK